MNNILDLDITYTDEVKRILSKSKLPTVDLNLSTQRFIGILSSDKLIGIGALELYGSSALLRSMAVIYSGQNKGIGTNLVTGLLDLARKNNVSELFLLTETAEKFFAKNGFSKINRSEVPAEILQTEEFKNLCPSTAVCMSLALN
ncbi:MAG: arsenic resistance N-acetyltransferase ArsN2 [Bacteroidota bacterium]